MIPDKLTIIAKLPNEAQRLFDDEIKKAYERGTNDALVSDKAKFKLASQIKETLQIFGIIAFVMMIIAAIGVGCNSIINLPPSPKIESSIPKDITRTWVPVMEVDGGVVIYETRPVPGIRCFQWGKSNYHYMGCVNDLPNP